MKVIKLNKKKLVLHMYYTIRNYAGKPSAGNRFQFSNENIQISFTLTTRPCFDHLPMKMQI